MSSTLKIARGTTGELERTTAIRRPRLAYKTKWGRIYLGVAEDVLRDPHVRRRRGKIRLIFTSPPFPLNRKKKYGNLKGDEYSEWLSRFAPLFSEYLSRNGSIVMELGNAWEPGIPANSTLPLEALLAFKEAGDFYLCQEFVSYNPAKLPTPAQWVNVKRIRVKDAFTRLWWLSKSPRPYANNRNVLVEYSGDMKKLLATGRYNAGRRPSEHVIGATSFLHDNGGAIPSNVLMFANTRSSDVYLEYCKSRNLALHPSRMPADLAAFFVKFLTREKDTVLDPFAGSNLTGAVAQSLHRHWLSIEPEVNYVAGSLGRFGRDGRRPRLCVRIRRGSG